MSMFTQEDVSDMASGGNAGHNAKYLAKHNPRDVPIPNGSDVVKLRDFIKIKYLEKRWYSDDNAVESAPSAATTSSTHSHPTPSAPAVQVHGFLYDRMYF